MSRSTWYHNINALKRVDRHADLKAKISEIYHYHKGRYGYRRITLSLRKQGLPVNHKTVQRLMAELSLRSLIRVKKYRSWKGETGRAAPNILSRDFGASKANERCSAVTLGSGLAVSDGWLSGQVKGPWNDTKYVAQRKLPG